MTITVSKCPHSHPNSKPDPYPTAVPVLALFWQCFAMFCGAVCLYIVLELMLQEKVKK